MTERQLYKQFMTYALAKRAPYLFSKRMYKRIMQTQERIFKLQFNEES